MSFGCVVVVSGASVVVVVVVIVVVSGGGGVVVSTTSIPMTIGVMSFCSTPIGVVSSRVTC